MPGSKINHCYMGHKWISRTVMKNNYGRIKQPIRPPSAFNKTKQFDGIGNLPGNDRETYRYYRRGDVPGEHRPYYHCPLCTCGQGDTLILLTLIPRPQSGLWRICGPPYQQKQWVCMLNHGFGCKTTALLMSTNSFKKHHKEVRLEECWPFLLGDKKTGSFTNWESTLCLALCLGSVNK